jgi:hypothetical protein
VAFEAAMKAHACECIGVVTETPRLVVNGMSASPLIDLSIDELKTAWKAPFGDLV